MNKIAIVLIALVFTVSCSGQRAPITIVDIGNLDRNGLAKELQIINKYSTKVVALDFMLTTDSLTKDEALSTELSKVRNLVQSTILHNYVAPSLYWDSLETFNTKFSRGNSGFSNITTTEDSVFVPELPMRQHFRTQVVTSLSYAIADNSFGVKPKYKVEDDRYFYFNSNNIGRFFRIISVEELMSGKFDKTDLDNKIVIMGHAGPGENTFYLDRRRTRQISGVEIQACIVSQLINLE